jgi:uncharacterized membrane protein/protein-disulfide isomerase
MIGCLNDYSTGILMSSVNSIFDSVNSEFQVGQKTDHQRRGSGVESTTPKEHRHGLFATMLVIAIVALGFSSYLAWAALTSSKVAGCGGSSVFDCGHVLTSKWSTAYGIPVGLLAGSLYVVMIPAILTSWLTTGSKLKQVANFVVITSAISASLAAIWFISLQVFVLEHLCQYCLAAHGCGLALLGIAMFAVKPSWGKTLAAGGIAAIGFGVIATGQVLAEKPQTFEIEVHAPAPTQSATPSETATELFSAPGQESNEDSAGDDDLFLPPDVSKHDLRSSIRFATIQLFSGGHLSAAFLTAPNVQEETTQQGDKPRVVSVQGGSVKLDARHWPIIGDKDAKRIFVEMFDYTCPHCRKTHQTMKQMEQQDAEGAADIAVIALCVPMNNQCNGTVRVTNAQHASACELGNLAVAVWRVDSSKFSEFHDWLFEGPVAPSAQQARLKAASMVSKERLDKELASGIPGKFIARHVQMYQKIGGGTIPKILFPRTTLSGEIGSPQTLRDLINRQFGN